MSFIVYMFGTTIAFIAGGIGVFMASTRHLPPAFLQVRRWLRLTLPRLFPPTPRLFILDPDGKPVPAADEEDWADWFQANHSKRNVASYSTTYEIDHGQKTTIVVSTIFLGVDHNFSAVGPPLLFETIVQGGLLDGERIRYATKDEALDAHEQIMATQFRLLKCERICSSKPQAQNNGVVEVIQH